MYPALKTVFVWCYNLLGETDVQCCNLLGELGVQNCNLHGETGVQNCNLLGETGVQSYNLRGMIGVVLQPAWRDKEGTAVLAEQTDRQTDRQTGVVWCWLVILADRLNVLCTHVYKSIW